MDKKILICGSIVAVVILILASVSPVTGSQSTKPTNTTIQKFLFARVYWNPFEVEEETEAIIAFSNGHGGPFGMIDYGFVFGLKVTMLIINGTIFVKPLSEPKITLYPGDKISIGALSGWYLSYWETEQSIAVLHGIGVTVETNSDSSG